MVAGPRTAAASTWARSSSARSRRGGKPDAAGNRSWRRSLSWRPTACSISWGMRTRHRLVTGRCFGSGTMRFVKNLLSGEPNATAGRYPSWVRTVGLVIAFSLVMAVSAPAPARASTAELVQQLDGLISSFPGGAGIWIADPAIATPLYSHDPDEQVIAASLYKLGVLAEAERRVDAGELHYGDVITIEPEDITSDGSFEDAGAQLTLDQALEAMITISDNGSALALWRILGGANIDATLEKAGVQNFHVAYDDNEDNWVTPRAVGTFFTLLAKRQLISAAASDRMLSRLERQQISDRLPAQLPAGVVIAHKTGNLSGVTHDAGIIFTKTGPRVVVALTWDMNNAQGALLMRAPKPLPLPALLPQQTQSVAIVIPVPQQPGTYTVTIGLADAAGTALAPAGAATATFSLRAHLPYLISAQLAMPRTLHRGEASLVVLNYGGFAGETDRPLLIGWRLIDPRTNRTVQQGSSPAGFFKTGVTGTFFVPFIAPSSLGTYRLSYELRDGTVSVSEPTNATVEIAGPRTYPDEGIPAPSGEFGVAPAQTPRFEFPTITIPKPSIEIPFLHGRSPKPSTAP